jgi:hypothetical protein
MPNAGDLVRASDVAVQGCRVTSTASQSINDNTTTTVTFDDELWDNDGMHSNVTNNSRITIVTAGIYVVTFQGRFASANDYVEVYATLRLNGGTDIALGPYVVTTTAIPPKVLVTTTDEFVAGDYLEVQVLQNNSANVARDLALLGVASPIFSAARLGSGVS